MLFYSVAFAFRTEKKQIYSNFHCTHQFQSHLLIDSLIYQAMQMKMHVSAEVETSDWLRRCWLASDFSECQILTVSCPGGLRPGSTQRNKQIQCWGSKTAVAINQGASYRELQLRTDGEYFIRQGASPHHNHSLFSSLAVKSWTGL